MLALLGAPYTCEAKDPSVHYFLCDLIREEIKEIPAEISGKGFDTHDLKTELSPWIEALKRERDLKSESKNSIRKSLGSHLADLIERLSEIEIEYLTVEKKLDKSPKKSKLFQIITNPLLSKGFETIIKGGGKCSPWDRIALLNDARVFCYAGVRSG